MKKQIKTLAFLILLYTFNINQKLYAQATSAGAAFTPNQPNTAGVDYLGWDNTVTVPLEIRHDNPGYSITFHTNGAPQMTIDGTTGFVGVGTTLFLERLSVNGNIHLTNQTSTINLNSGNQVFIANPIPGNIFMGINAGIGVTTANACTMIGLNAGATTPITGGGGFIISIN